MRRAVALLSRRGTPVAVGLTVAVGSAAAGIGANSHISHSFSSGYDPEEYERRMQKASLSGKTTATFNKPSRWNTADLVHVATHSNGHSPTLFAREVLVGALQGFADHAMRESLPRPPPVRVMKSVASEEDVRLEFTLPPSTTSEQVLHALLAQDGPSEGGASLAAWAREALRHAARVEESRLYVTTRLTTPDGVFELREPKAEGDGVVYGASGARLLVFSTASGRGLRPSEASRLAAAYGAAHHHRAPERAQLSGGAANAAGGGGSNSGEPAAAARGSTLRPATKASHAGAKAALGAVSATGGDVDTPPAALLQELGARVFLSAGGAAPAGGSGGGGTGDASLLSDRAERYAAGQ